MLKYNVLRVAQGRLGTAYAVEKIVVDLPNSAKEEIGLLVFCLAIRGIVEHQRYV